MFASVQNDPTPTPKQKPEKEESVPFIPGQQYVTPDTKDSMNYSAIDGILEKEKQQNKTETWNKLDKTVKIQKLHSFAEKYGKEHALPVKDVRSLKLFFVESLEKMKLQKTKDVVYNKDTHEVTGIPALHFNSEKRCFTLKIMDARRVSTLKSLTPKRMIATPE